MVVAIIDVGVVAVIGAVIAIFVAVAVFVAPRRGPAESSRPMTHEEFLDEE